jgi:hypothetical protein
MILMNVAHSNNFELSQQLSGFGFSIMMDELEVGARPAIHDHATIVREAEVDAGHVPEMPRPKGVGPQKYNLRITFGEFLELRLRFACFKLFKISFPCDLIIFDSLIKLISSFKLVDLLGVVPRKLHGLQRVLLFDGADHKLSQRFRGAKLTSCS